MKISDSVLRMMVLGIVGGSALTTAAMVGASQGASASEAGTSTSPALNAEPTPSQQLPVSPTPTPTAEPTPGPAVVHHWNSCVGCGRG